MDAQAQPQLTEVLPKSGLVYSEKGDLPEIVCKPKLMPLKSATLEKIMALDKAASQIPGAAKRIQTAMQFQR
jgi:BBSome-interacting protein 1